MPMDLGTRNTLLCDFMHCMTAVSLEMSDEPDFIHFHTYFIYYIHSFYLAIHLFRIRDVHTSRIKLISS